MATAKTTGAMVGNWLGVVSGAFDYEGVVKHVAGRLVVIEVDAEHAIVATRAEELGCYAQVGSPFRGRRAVERAISSLS
jgi:hypothetical protein